MLAFGWWTGGGYHVFLFICSLFVMLLMVLVKLVHDGSYACFFVPLFGFFASTLFN